MAGDLHQCLFDDSTFSICKRHRSNILGYFQATSIDIKNKLL